MAANEHGLRVEVRHRGEVVVLDLIGDIDRDADAALQRAYDQAVAPGGSTARVLLNFARVGYINSTGIAVIVGLLARARTEHRLVTACALSDHYHHVFRITRLSDFIGLYPDEDSAVGLGVPTAQGGNQ